MGKVGAVIVVVIATIMVYVALLVAMPILTEFASTANTTMAATSNLTNYPGAAEGVLMAPWFVWFAPGIIGMTIVVVILKSP